MKFIVDNSKLLIEYDENENSINSGSIEDYLVDVEFSDEWDGLTKAAKICIDGENTGIERAVIDGQVYIDMEEHAKYAIGFIGYTIENNVKIYQKSTNLKKLTYKKGAGEIETENEDIPTPSEWEIYIAQIQEMIDQGGGGGTATNIDGKTITNNEDNEIQTVGIIDSKSGAVLKLWCGLKAEYNDIQEKDPNTIYYITDEEQVITETDPTVPNHVKQITALDIQNWNNKSNFSGSYNDLTNKPSIPDELKDLSDDSTHRLVTDTEKSTWNNKSNFSGNYNDLSNKPTIPTVPTNLSSFTDDLGSSPTHTHSQYLTSHQDISGKLDTTKVKNAQSTTAGDVYDVTYINTALGDIETLLSGI